MAADKLLERMRSNPRDWTIADVERLCRHHGVTCMPPRGGSHFKVTHHSQDEILTVPAKRPIKPVYIRHLVRFVEAVVEAGS